MNLWSIRPKILPILAALVYTMVWAPVIILVLYSFSNNKLGIKWEGFTLKWYSALLDNTTLIHALRTSLIIASIVVVVATIMGALVGYGLYKYKFRGKRALRTSLLVPIMMPGVVTGGALLVFFLRLAHIPLGYPSIIIAHITFSIPLAAFIVLGRMARIDWTLEEASADLGASKLTTWRKITLPLLLPALIASAALIFPWSFDDFVITFFVAGPGSTTLPLYVFSQLRYGETPVVINTIGTIFIALPVVGILLMNFFQKREVA